MADDEITHNQDNEITEYHEFSETIEINEVEEQEGIHDGKHLVKKKRRERLVRKGRMKQERFRAFVRFFLSLFFIFFLVYGLRCKGWYMDKKAFTYVGGRAVEIINNKIVPSHKIMVLLKRNNVSI